MRSPKRHSTQRSRLPWILSLLVAAVLLLSAVIGLAVLARWIRSEACRSLLEAKASEALGGKAEVGPLEWLWIGVASPQIKGTGDSGNPVRSFDAANVRAKLKPASLLKGFWGIEEIALEKAHLHFGSSGAAATPPSTTSTASNSPARLPSWIPTLLVVEAVRSGDTELLFDLPEGKFLRLTGTKLAFFPESRGTRIEASGGDLLWSRFPDFPVRLTSARGRIDNGLFRLNGAELAFVPGGSARLEGRFPDDTGTSRLECTWKEVPVAGVLPAAKDHLAGTLSGSSRTAWNAEGLISLEGSVSSSDAEIRGTPGLEDLARFTGMEQFRRLSLQKASASFTRQGTVTRWHDILLESQGVLKFTGDADVGDEGTLSGNFQLGITTDIMRVIPMAKELLSAEEHDGYLWMPVHVGGTLSHPTEDLHPRLVEAVAAKAAGVIRSGLEEGLKFLGIKPDSMSNSPASPAPSPATNAIKTLEQGAGSVIDAVGGFLK